MPKVSDNMVKAVFFDVDGTLVSFRDHIMSEESVRTLDALKRKGIKVFIASGRPKIFMNNLRDYPFDGYICMNGALVYVGDKVLFHHPADSDDIKTVARIAGEHDIPCAVYFRDGVKMNRHTDLTLEIFRELAIDPPAESDISVIEEDIYQYNLFLDEKKEAEILTPYLKNMVSTRWHPAFIDLIPKSLSKAEGIAKVIDHYGITREETMAFGDGGNDIEMLEYAGVGIAMDNASDIVKSYSDYVTLSVDDEGVTAALRHFGLL